MIGIASLSPANFSSFHSISIHHNAITAPKQMEMLNIYRLHMFFIVPQRVKNRFEFELSSENIQNNLAIS